MKDTQGSAPDKRSMCCWPRCPESSTQVWGRLQRPERRSQQTVPAGESWGPGLQIILFIFTSVFLSLWGVLVLGGARGYSGVGLVDIHWPSTYL